MRETTRDMNDQKGRDPCVVMYRYRIFWYSATEYLAIDKTACKPANDVFKKTNKGYVLRKKTNTFFDGTIYTTRFYVVCSENIAA